jgi:hypothetical protein
MLLLVSHSRHRHRATYYGYYWPELRITYYLLISITYYRHWHYAYYCITSTDTGCYRVLPNIASRYETVNSSDDSDMMLCCVSASRHVTNGKGRMSSNMQGSNPPHRPPPCKLNSMRLWTAVSTRAGVQPAHLPNGPAVHLVPCPIRFKQR